MDLLGTDFSLDEIKGIPGDTEFALEAILAEYGGSASASARPEPEEKPSPALPIEAGEDADAIIAEISSEAPDSYPPDEPPARPEVPNAAPVTDAEADGEDEGEAEEDTGHADAEPDEAEDAETDDAADEEPDEDEDGEPPNKVWPFSSASAYGPDSSSGGYVPPEEGFDPSEPEPPRRSFGEGLAAPLVSILAFFTMRRKIRSGGGEARAPEDEEDEGEELDAESAARYYSGHLKSLRTRLRLSVVLSVVLIWLSFGLPAAGMLKETGVRALMCLILELSIVMLGLDIFTSGVTGILRGRISLWSLLSVSCVASALDAAVTAAAGLGLEGLPFCGAAGLSMTFALAGSLQGCRGYRMSLRALSLARDAFAVTAESGVSEDGVTLLKSKRGTAGYLRRCEEPDLSESVYGALAPFLLIAALILSLAAAWLSDNWPYFFRIFAALTAPCAPFAAFLAFPLPYSILSRRLFQSGAAVAGWSGLRDIGRSKHLIVTDRDIFPTGTISVDSIRVLEGTWPEKIISCAGSIICASGSCLAPAFAELMRRNNCSIQRVEDFCCHEGGGLTAMINGEEILCGNAGFMRLMSVRLPQKMASKSSVFISVNGVLSAIFIMKYVPVTSVQDALVSLLHTRRDPIFAVRDFNVTPLMIRQKFRMPTDGFDFPPFAERYKISAAEPSPDSQISAIISREGLGPLVETADRSRRSYVAALLAVILSVVCTLVGLALMFMLCLSGSFDSATCGNLLTYMFLWLVPVIILAFGLAR